MYSNIMRAVDISGSTVFRSNAQSITVPVSRFSTCNCCSLWDCFSKRTGVVMSYYPVVTYPESTVLYKLSALRTSLWSYASTSFTTSSDNSLNSRSFFSCWHHYRYFSASVRTFRAGSEGMLKPSPSKTIWTAVCRSSEDAVRCRRSPVHSNTRHYSK